MKSVLFLLGAALCSYPFISSFSEQKNLDRVIATYQAQSVGVTDKERKEELERAERYNRRLYQLQESVIGGNYAEIQNEEGYDSLLNMTGNGIMGSIEIPKIDVHLPIYHGTSEEVLVSGIGHIEGTSLPIGGENTRTVLTGHRGLPNSKLFTRLDEMEEGDLFFLRILNEVLAYQVNKIEIINPEEAEKLHITQGKDLATLLTCTPYGINTHRLLVTGERVEFVQADYDRIEPEMISARELLFAGLPVIIIGYGVFQSIRTIKRKWKGKRDVR